MDNDNGDNNNSNIYDENDFGNYDRLIIKMIKRNFNDNKFDNKNDYIRIITLIQNIQNI